MAKARLRHAAGLCTATLARMYKGESETRASVERSAGDVADCGPGKDGAENDAAAQGQAEI